VLRLHGRLATLGSARIGEAFIVVSSASRTTVSPADQPRIHSSSSSHRAHNYNPPVCHRRSTTVGPPSARGSTHPLPSYHSARNRQRLSGHSSPIAAIIHLASPSISNPESSTIPIRPPLGAHKNVCVVSFLSIPPIPSDPPHRPPFDDLRTQNPRPRLHGEPLTIQNCRSSPWPPSTQRPCTTLRGVDDDSLRLRLPPLHSLILRLSACRGPNQRLLQSVTRRQSTTLSFSHLSRYLLLIDDDLGETFKTIRRSPLR
jgi:hypothetical protein